MFGSLFSKSNVVNISEIKNLHESDSFLLDVRNPDETVKGIIPGAHLIPLGELEKRVGEIPKNRKIYVYCHSGMRSANACRFLQEEGFDCYNVKGGYVSYLASR